MPTFDIAISTAGIAMPTVAIVYSTVELTRSSAECTSSALIQAADFTAVRKDCQYRTQYFFAFDTPYPVSSGADTAPNAPARILALSAVQTLSPTV
jgi:hypothetical protein